MKKHIQFTRKTIKPQILNIMSIKHIGKSYQASYNTNTSLVRFLKICVVQFM